MSGVFKTFTILYSLFVVIPIALLFILNNSILFILLKILLVIIIMFTIASAYYSFMTINLGPFLVLLGLLSAILFMPFIPDWLGFIVSFFTLTLFISKFKHISRVAHHIEEQSKE